MKSFIEICSCPRNTITLGYALKLFCMSLLLTFRSSCTDFSLVPFIETKLNSKKYFEISHTARSGETLVVSPNLPNGLLKRAFGMID